MDAEPGIAWGPESHGESPSEFYMHLQSAMQQRRDALEKDDLPKLRENFRVFHLSYQTLYNVLSRKGLIDEDPYKNDQKISDIAPPSSSPFLDSERDTQMSVRLSEFDSQLEFLYHYYQFSFDFLDLKRLKSLVGLANYISWSQLTTTSQNTTTRVLAELVDKVKKGGDQLSASVMGDSHDQLAKLQRAILSGLKTIADFQRESYKLMLRKDIMPDVDLPSGPLSHMEDSVKAIKKIFTRSGRTDPFYPELAQEILVEDHAPNSDQRRSEVLRKLAPVEKKAKAPKKDEELRRTLVESLRSLAHSSRSLSDSVMKLRDNSIVLENRRLSFGERFRRWVMKAVGRKERKQSYEVKYNDITTSAVQRETIEFEDFCRQVEQKSRLFAGILSRMGSVAAKIEAASEEQLFSFVARNLAEAQIIFRRLQSLDAFFKDAVSENERSQMRGIKIELTGIKNHIIKANQKKHEYVARKDEGEQLRKLGIGDA